MNDALDGLRIGFLCNQHPTAGRSGSLFERLAPLLRERGARVEAVHGEDGSFRLNERPSWDLTVLKSESAAALHLAAAAEAHGVPSLNSAEATRVAEDRLASAAILRRAGLPVPAFCFAYLGPNRARSIRARFGSWVNRTLILKPACGHQGAGLWTAEAGEIEELAVRMPSGPYLVMEKVPHEGDDLKVYVAGGWMAAIERPFPARGLQEKLGRPADVPEEVAAAAREAGRLLGLTCYGCDFVRGPEGWSLVDTNAFPGYKGLEGAPEALAAEIERAAEERAMEEVL
ncbi:MAG: hypothetical protein M3Q49_05755 [Actinomycetota bacterium]|nr:hypothetical protein [Actinomycetota bacterium]